MDIYRLSESFPKRESYSLTDQIRRSSRSVSANIAEGFRKRHYPKYFISKLIDALAESAETEVWLDFSKECNYLNDMDHRRLVDLNNEIGKMLAAIIKNPQKFLR